MIGKRESDMQADSKASVGVRGYYLADVYRMFAQVQQRTRSIRCEKVS